MALNPGKDALPTVLRGQALIQTCSGKNVLVTQMRV